MTQSILNDPFKNKGTAFTETERQQLGLVGMLPPMVQTLDQQAEQVYQQYQSKSSALEKHKKKNTENTTIDNKYLVNFFFLLKKFIFKFEQVKHRLLQPLVHEKISQNL